MNRISNIIFFLAFLVGVFADDKYCEDRSWLKFEDNCYSFENALLSFYDAEDLCRSKGAHLVSIHSQEENDFIERKISERYSGRRWIGLTINDNNNDYKWSDDTDVGYLKIAEKTQYVKEKCHIFFFKQGWRLDHCELRNYPLCKKSVKDVTPSPLPPVTTMLPEGNCPQDWLQFNKKCYKFYGSEISNRVQYKEAKEACLALGPEYDLVSIHNAEEQAFLVQKLGEFGSSAWIGLNHITSDEIGHISVFGWTDNSRVDFTNWAPGHPKPGTWKYCVRLNYEGLSKGEWISDYCGTGKYGYICSRPSVPGLPTQSPPPSLCGEGYQQHGNSCYRAYSNPETWSDAEETCRRQNGHLVSITDSFEEAFLYRLVNGQASSMWNGLRTIENTLILRWSDKQPFYYSKWSADQPRISADSSCISMMPDTLDWTVVSCERKLPFICKTTNELPPSFPDDIVGNCQGKETQLFDIGDEYCYHMATKNKIQAWGSFHRYCITRGMEMITVHGEHQMKSLMTYAGRKPYDFWLGLITSFDRESFVWMDGSPLNYTNWAEHEPALTWFDYDCAGFSSENSKWAIKDCNRGLGSICRIKKIVPV